MIIGKYDINKAWNGYSFRRKHFMFLSSEKKCTSISLKDAFIQLFKYCYHEKRC